MAVETLVNITQDEIEYARMCILIKSQLDYQSGMVGAERKGRAEGKFETARNLKALGISMDIISQSTGLSSEEIAKL